MTKNTSYIRWKKEKLRKGGRRLTLKISKSWLNGEYNFIFMDHDYL